MYKIDLGSVARTTIEDDLFLYDMFKHNLKSNRFLISVPAREPKQIRIRRIRKSKKFPLKQSRVTR